MGSTVRSLLPSMSPRGCRVEIRIEKGVKVKKTRLLGTFFLLIEKRRVFGAPTLHPPVCPLLAYITLPLGTEEAEAEELIKFPQARTLLVQNLPRI